MKKMKMLNQMMFGCLFVASTLTVSPALANIVSNPGFENGSAGWTFLGFEVDPFYANSGTNSAGTGCVGHECVSTRGTGAFISQALSTVAGQNYNLSFFVGENAGPTSEFSVFFNGVQVADVLNPANYSLSEDGSTFIQFSFSNLLATTSSTLLEIHGRQDPAGIYFDDVSVTASGGRPSNVPEPAPLALLGVGLVGFIAARRKATK